MTADYEPEAGPSMEPEGPETEIEEGVAPLRNPGPTKRGKTNVDEGTTEAKITPPAGFSQQYRGGGEALSGKWAGRFVEKPSLNTSAADLSPGPKLQREILESGVLSKLEKVTKALEPVLNETYTRREHIVPGANFQTAFNEAKKTLSYLRNLEKRYSDPLLLASTLHAFSLTIKTLQTQMGLFSPVYETLQNALTEVKKNLDIL